MVQSLRLSLTGVDPDSITFYKLLQNEKVRQGEAYHRGQGEWIGTDWFLRRQGMSPSDTILDVDLLKGLEQLCASYDFGTERDPTTNIRPITYGC